VHGLHAATSKVVNSAQGSSCKLKFVHGYSSEKCIVQKSLTIIIQNCNIFTVQAKGRNMTKQTLFTLGLFKLECLVPILQVCIVKNLFGQINVFIYKSS
jgi:hypothetical protein